MNNRCRIITRMLQCLASLLLAFCATSCADIEDQFEQFKHGDQDSSGLLKMSYSVDGMNYQTRSAVVAARHETTLNHVHILFFSSLDESYVTAVQAQVITSENPDGVKRTFSFSIPSTVHQDTDYKVIAVGNGDNFIPIDPNSGSQYDSYLAYIETICPNHTYSEVKNALEFYNPQPMCAKSTPLLPMYGELINNAHSEIPFNYTIDGDSYAVNGEFYFKRAVSRIDFTNIIPDKIMVDYVKLVNIRSGGLAYQDGKNCGDVVEALDGEDVAGPVDGVNGWVRVSNELTSNQQQLKESLYAFPDIVSATAPNDEVTTALLIAGRYGKDTGLTYYRFNLSPAGQPLSMLRNHIYTAIAKNITGRGDATEAEAMRREKPVLTAEIVEDWGDDSSVTTDSEGNFLILSRTTVTLEGTKDQTEVIQVKVNDGTTWDLQIVEQTGHSNDKFEMKTMSDGTSFYVKTLEDNTTYTLRKGYINIVATTKQGNKLIAPFIVQQVPNEVDPKYLLVENSSETYVTTVAGVGGNLNLQIETGSSVEGWKCTEVNIKSKTEKKDSEGNSLGYEYEFEDVKPTVRDALTNKFNTSSTQIGTYTSGGSHMGHLIVNLKANISKENREMALKVEREMPADYSGEPIKPIYVVISQPKSEYLISVFPYPENGTLYIEGFTPNRYDDSRDLSNAISAQEEIFVSLADPDNYTFEVTSSFDFYRDLRLTANAKLPVTTKCSHYNAGGVPVYQRQDTETGAHAKLRGMTNGQKFFINVFATGPGDPDIQGEIVVRAVPKNAENEVQEITFHVTITTSCKIEDVIVPFDNNYLLVADRNCGAKPRLNDSKGFVPALNYTAHPYLHITGYGDITNTDNRNSDFRGEQYAYCSSNDDNWNNSLFFSSSEVTRPDVMYREFTEKNIDQDELYSIFYKSGEQGWRMPSNSEWTNKIAPYIRWSKYRAYIISSLQDKSGSTPNYIGCFIPFDSDGSAMYRTSSRYNTNYAYYISINSDMSFNSTYSYKTYEYLFRPVRTVSPAELTKYKSKFLGQ